MVQKNAFGNWYFLRMSKNLDFIFFTVGTTSTGMLPGKYHRSGFYVYFVRCTPKFQVPLPLFWDTFLGVEIPLIVVNTVELPLTFLLVHIRVEIRNTTRGYENSEVIVKGI